MLQHEEPDPTGVRGTNKAKDTKVYALGVSHDVIGAAIEVHQLLDCEFRLDLVIAGTLIVEVKALEKIMPIHRAQLLSYLRLHDVWLGLLINFNVEVLRDGIRRVLNG